MVVGLLPLCAAYVHDVVGCCCVVVAGIIIAFIRYYIFFPFHLNIEENMKNSVVKRRGDFSFSHVVVSSYRMKHNIIIVLI